MNLWQYLCRFINEDDIERVLLGPNQMNEGNFDAARTCGGIGAEPGELHVIEGSCSATVMVWTSDAVWVCLTDGRLINLPLMEWPEPPNQRDPEWEIER